MNGYVITDNSKTMFVCKGANNAYALTTDPDKAIIWDSKITVDAVFKSNLPKSIRDKGLSVRAVPLQMRFDKPQHEQTQPEAGSSRYIISVLSEAAAKLNVRHATLNEELSVYDRQITDVEHYIEFNAGKLNAYEGYQAYKLLQDVLLKRRKVKDELQMINVVRDKMSISSDIDGVNARIIELENQTYKPREFKHLFE